ncbi:protein NO VEIN domain-containing protein [Micromonospora purpureochromogenes]|uniref:protein NO VEIN domain-containing protein n=1 Tax=Micromonospora purpureochromogenes TaxID=47872 RepID=UPI00362E68E9
MPAADATYSEAMEVGQHRGRDANRLVTVENLGAWMLKCNPGVWDLAAFLKDGGETIDRWSVVPNYRTALMDEGQQVLFWVTGPGRAYPEPGLWGRGSVLGPAGYIDTAHEDPGYWRDEHQRRQSKHFVPVDIRLFHEPISRTTLRGNRRLAGLEVFRQPQMGNPLVVSKTELAVLDRLLPPQPQKITVTAFGAGFGNPINNAEVEAAAMKAAIRHYRRDGWRVQDVSKRNEGWDLTCTSGDGEVHRVEVKGVSGLNPKVLLTRNEERSAREDPGWRLAVVTKALVEPTLQFFDADMTLRAAAPFVFEVDLRQSRPVTPHQRRRETRG